MPTNIKATCLKCESRAANIFCNLPPELLKLLDEGKIPRFYKKKQILYYEGNPATGLFCIQSGRVKTYKTGPEGKQYILQIGNTHDVLGLGSIFGNQHFLATAEVMEEGVICFIDKGIIHEIVRRNTQTASHIIQILAQNLKTSEEERMELAQLAVRERMARLLALLAQSHGIQVKKGTLIDLKLSREEMAEMIGTASETAMRLLKEFKDDKLVEVRGKDITVLDKDRLVQTAQLLE